MSTDVESPPPPPAILIPSLPNDVALQCLARVPRQYHPVLAAVSKPIRALLSSPDFFAARSSLNCTENLLYLRIQIKEFQPARWFTVYRRPSLNSATGSIIMAPVPEIPNSVLDWAGHAAVGPKIYVFSGDAGDCVSTEMWILDCRFHTWERGPSMPTARKHGVKTVVLDGKIYTFGWPKVDNSWGDVFDTEAGSWEALPSPGQRDYQNPVGGCGVRGGMVCVWMEQVQEELRFDPETKMWEVFSLVLPMCTPKCEVNGVLYSTNYSITTLKGLDEISGFWRPLNLVNGGGLPKNLLVSSMANVGGKLVIMGCNNLRDWIGPSECEGTTRVWCAEIEVKNSEGLEFDGEVIWAEMVYSYGGSMVDAVNLSYSCVQVSL